MEKDYLGSKTEKFYQSDLNSILNGGGAKIEGYLPPRTITIFHKPGVTLIVTPIARPVFSSNIFHNFNPYFKYRKSDQSMSNFSLKSDQSG